MELILTIQILQVTYYALAIILLIAKHWEENQ